MMQTTTDMKRNVLTLIVCCIAACVFGQNVKRPDSYNYSRGVEAIRNKNLDEALEYLYKEVKENPNNGYAYTWIAYVQHEQEEYGSSLSNINNAIKKLPSKDKEFRASAYSIRSEVYLCLEDTVSALKDYTTAISIDPNNSDWYKKRAQVYYEQQRYDEANKDYDKIIALDEGGVMGYMGKGRNFNAQKRYEDAIPLFDYVTKLHKDYSSGYSFRADSYFGLKKYDKALDDVITALGIDGDNKAFAIMRQLSDSAYVETVAKFKVQKIKEPNVEYWDYCLGIIHEQHDAYVKAIEQYKVSLKKDASDITASRIANCYEELGDYDHALEYWDMAIQLDSADVRHILSKANTLDNKGCSKEAIALLDELLAKHTDYGFAYYRRGWIKENSGDREGALEDYALCISLIPDYAYAYMNRARMYDVLGEKDKAKADYLKGIELDEKGKDAEMSFYCYYYLGEKDKAIEALEKTLELDNKGNYYDAACLYSIMGEKDKAIEYLHKCLEKGYTRFAHIRRDRDLDNIRNDERYEKLLSEYEEKLRQRLVQDASPEDTADYEESVVEVPFTKEGGVCRVKCNINGLPLHFIFDTGAADVSLSSVEATFMVKNDYLQKSDFGGSQYYMNANGSVTEGVTVNLKNITFGGLSLDNVKASVVKAQSAPLLLGQSVLGRLGKIEIDNMRGVLKITSKHPKR